MSAHLIDGHPLKGQAREVPQQAKLTGDPVLCSKAPLVGDIVACLLRYYQLNFRYLILLGKPMQGAVINKWMAEVQFDVDTAAGKLERYQELPEYLLLKSRTDARRASKAVRLGRYWHFMVEGDYS